VHERARGPANAGMARQICHGLDPWHGEVSPRRSRARERAHPEVRERARGDDNAGMARQARDRVSEAVCKPSSVPPYAEARVGDGHPSVAAGCPAALAAYPRAGQRTSPPRRSPGTGYALLFGLAPGGVCRVSLRRPTRKPVGGIVTVALVLVSRRTGVTRHPALRSSDFPHALHGVAPDVARSHPTASLTRAFYCRRSAAPDWT